MNYGVLAGYTNADVGMVLLFDDLSKHGRVLGNITSRIDFACYKCGLPPIGLCADASFSHAWEQRERDWPFPKESMQAAAQSKHWTVTELNEIRAKARDLPGQASASWNKEFKENQGDVKQWAESLTAEASVQSVVEDAAEKELAVLNDTPEAEFEIGKTIERGSMGRRVKQANDFKCQICEALGLNPHGFVKENGEPYVEAHHVTPVSKMQIGSLAADNIMTLCANHHRQLHYGVVSVEIKEKEFELMIDESRLTIKRHSFLKNV